MIGDQNYMNSYDNEMLSKYDEYLNAHIEGVLKAFYWLYENIPNICNDYDEDELLDVIRAHDKSKFEDAEYYSYANYFYGEKTDDVNIAFKHAWLHHQHTNAHHWQHWLLQNDEEGLEVLEMPKIYCIEMICDWWAFSWNKNNLFEIFDWYEANKKKIKLHKNSKKFVEETLAAIKTKLEEKDTHE